METTTENIVLEIYYDHDERKISDNNGKTYSYEEVSQLILKYRDLDRPLYMNKAMERLILNDGNMELVEEFYRQNP